MQEAEKVLPDESRSGSTAETALTHEAMVSSSPAVHPSQSKTTCRRVMLGIPSARPLSTKRESHRVSALASFESRSACLRGRSRDERNERLLREFNFRSKVAPTRRKAWWLFLQQYRITSGRLATLDPTIFPHITSIDLK